MLWLALVIVASMVALGVLESPAFAREQLVQRLVHQAHRVERYVGVTPRRRHIRIRA